MLEPCFAPYRFNNNYLAKQLQSIEEAQADHIPTQGVKPPRWLVGHMGFAISIVGKIVERPDCCVGFEESWAAYYGPGSDSTLQHDDAPSLQQLEEILVGSEAKIIESLSALNETDFQAPHGLDLLTGTPLVTKADLAAHLLTTHYCFHLGELAIWRRTMGVPVIF